MLNVAQVIKTEREKQRISQKDMAPVIGVGRRQYQRLEGEGKFTLCQLYNLCAKLKLKLLVVAEDDLNFLKKGAKEESPVVSDPLPPIEIITKTNNT